MVVGTGHRAHVKNNFTKVGGNRLGLSEKKLQICKKNKPQTTTQYIHYLASSDQQKDDWQAGRYKTTLAAQVKEESGLSRGIREKVERDSLEAAQPEPYLITCLVVIFLFNKIIILMRRKFLHRICI